MDGPRVRGVKLVGLAAEGADLGEADLPARGAATAGKWVGKPAPESPLSAAERGSDNEEEEEEEEEEEVSDTDAYPDTDDDVLDASPSLRLAACGSTDDLLALFSNREAPEEHEQAATSLDEVGEEGDICPAELPNYFGRMGRQDAIRGHFRRGRGSPRGRPVMVDSFASVPAPDPR
ncbi:hypothetical protein E2C01_100010 [Portunus trituberculatus]|uniref:Uncharacterized protein n=1 Tax=Portunus trituberculatus TaxID=210409 RepID=A0A5B7KAY2_PORTR|nr:hypothetical protein [Portunus trituberculatus]